MPEYKVTTPAVAVTSVTRTMVWVGAPAARRPKIKRVVVSFDGATPSNEPVKVDLLRQTTAGSMTAGTVVKRDPAEPAALCTVAHSADAEPTPSDILESWYVTPNGGLLDYTYPPGDEPIIASSTAGALRATAPDNVNAIASIYWGE